MLVILALLPTLAEYKQKRRKGLYHIIGPLIFLVIGIYWALGWVPSVSLPVVFPAWSH